jgi:hypothetical protein
MQMRPILFATAAVLLAASATAQTPETPRPPAAEDKQPEARGRLLGYQPPAVRPALVPCEPKGGLIDPVVRMCPLPKDAPWPPPPRPKPESGIFPLDEI